MMQQLPLPGIEPVENFNLETLLCVGGPYDGIQLLVTENSGKATATFSVHAKQGYYERNNNVYEWHPVCRGTITPSR